METSKQLHWSFSSIMPGLIFVLICQTAIQSMLPVGLGFSTEAGAPDAQNQNLNNS